MKDGLLELSCAALLLLGWALATWGLASLLHCWQVWPLSAGATCIFAGYQLFALLTAEERGKIEATAQGKAPDAR